MPRAGLVLFLPLLFVACASQPEKPAGKYAVVLDPQLEQRHMFHGVPLLHYSVRAALMQHLEIASTPAAADAVIVLKPARELGRLEYEIHRGDRVVSGSAAVPMMVAGSQRSIGEQLEAQRNREYARGDPSIQITRRDPSTYRPAYPGVSYESAQVEAVFKAGNRIAADIVRELGKR